MSDKYSPFPFLPILRRAVLALIFVCALFTFFTARAEAASISGRVTDINGEPVYNAAVSINKFVTDPLNPPGYWTGVEGMYSYTNANGEYTINGFPPGTYRLEFALPFAYRQEFYNNHSSIETADNIVFASSNTALRGYDVVLALNGMIVGTVLDQSNKPIENISVSLWHGDTEQVADLPTWTDAQGKFGIAVLSDDPYVLKFDRVIDPYATEYYNDKPDFASAERLVVHGDEVLTVTANLRLLGTISGTVTDGHSKPLDVSFKLYKMGTDSSWSLVPDAIIDRNHPGQFSISWLQPGKYRLEFFGDTIVQEYYNNQSDFEQAEILDLTGSRETIEINAVVARRGIITGKATDVNGEPIESIEVHLHYKEDGAWHLQEQTLTKQNGTFELFAALPDRDYRIQFRSDGYHGDAPYMEEYYSNASTIEAAQTITVPVETTIPNINAVMRLENEVDADFVAKGRIDPFVFDFVNHSMGDVLSQKWDFGDGTTSIEISPTHTYTVSGVYTVTLTVTGAENVHTQIKKRYISAFDTPITNLDIQQSDPNGIPDTQPKVGQTIYFSATAAGSNVQYLWDFGDDTLAAASTATGQYVQHSYDASGNYTVTLTARNSGHEEVMTMPIIVQADEEPVSALALHGPSRAWVNSSISLSATVGVGDNVTYTWDFGDGESGTGDTVQHTYSEAGTYTITLTASNGVSEEVVTKAINVQEVEDEVEYRLSLPSLHVSP